MRIAYSAPGRCGIVGNPSDIYGGKVLSCSLPLRNYCELRSNEARDVPEGALWAAIEKRFPEMATANVEVRIRSEVPRSSGLAGSTAMLAAMVSCVREYLSLPKIEVAELAELVRDIERNDAGVMCGYQDAYMVTHGGLQLMDFTGKHPVNPGPTAQMSAVDAPLPFLLVTTGVERLSGSVHGPMSERWLAGEEKVVQGIERISALTEPALQALISGDLPLLAGTMQENQAIIAELGGSGPQIDALIETCLSLGARAAKLAGAGMGGTVIVLTEDLAGLRERLARLGLTQVCTPVIAAGIRREPETTAINVPG
jgi:galactokinase/mevalonate kinase-like predicted kinase